MAEKVLHAVIDQIEATTAVLDVDGTALRVPLSWLPSDAQREGAGIRIRLEPESTDTATASVERRLDRLRRNSRRTR